MIIFKIKHKTIGNSLCIHKIALVLKKSQNKDIKSLLRTFFKRFKSKNIDTAVILQCS